MTSSSRAAVVAAALLLGCGEPDPAPGPPAWTRAELESTWVWRIAYDEALAEAEVDAAARWLGGAGTWSPPGSSERPRARHEDGLAIAAIGATYNEAMCRLGTSGDAFGTEVPAGWVVAAEACRALGRDVSFAVPDVALPSRDDLVPIIDETVTVRGQPLRYRFLRPGQLEAASSALIAADPDPAWTVGTSVWGDLPGPAAGATPAEQERNAEDHIARWKTSLEGAGVEPTERAQLVGWVRRAVYRDLGRRTGDAGHLEEAIGAASRPAPGPGVDPLLLARLAQARFEAGEAALAAEILRSIEAADGWAFAGPAADACARVAVLPSTTATGVQR